MNSRRLGSTAAIRLSVLLLLLSVSILVPFALWGERIDLAVPHWLAVPREPLLIAALGVSLLIADVVLPIPSSVVAIGLCVSLGPVAGGLATFVGATLAFVAGYVLGRVMPEARLRRWSGEQSWDRWRNRARHHAQWWIVVARPLPMLAEMTAILAGVWRVPALQATLLAAASSAMMSLLYALSVAWGLDEPGVLPLLAVVLVLPTALWLLQHHLNQRMRPEGDPR